MPDIQEAKNFEFTVQILPPLPLDLFLYTLLLVNSFECLLLFTVLDIKHYLKFIVLKTSFTQLYLTLKSILQ